MNRRDALGGGLAFALLGAGMRGEDQAPKPGPFGHETGAVLIPSTVFFAGKTAPVQGRNTGGANLPGGMFLAGLVDSSGYSSGIQERYQAYLLLTTTVQFTGHALAPGAYGCGVVGGQLLVMNLGAEVLWTVPAPRDASLPRPTPLQIAQGTIPDEMRLYFGRNYAGFRKHSGT